MTVPELRALRLQVASVLATVDAALDRAGELPPGPEDVCPRCSSTDLADAGDVLVCGSCNANVRDGRVVA